MAAGKEVGGPSRGILAVARNRLPRSLGTPHPRRDEAVVRTAGRAPAIPLPDWGLVG